MSGRFAGASRICVPDLTPVPAAATDACPEAAQHTPAPVGYLAWHEWAGTMQRTHGQRKCPGCGLFKIWYPRTFAGALREDGAR